MGLYSALGLALGLQSSTESPQTFRGLTVDRVYRRLTITICLLHDPLHQCFAQLYCI